MGVPFETHNFLNKKCTPDFFKKFIELYLLTFDQV